MSDIAYIALGSNVGERERHLADARRRIAALSGVMVIAASSVEETAPIGPVAQGTFLNQMIAVRTDLDAHALLSQLHAIEAAGGRERGVRWGPRTIDLDIVKFGSLRCSTADLVVPHPELPNRSFWQRELAALIKLQAGGESGE